MQVFIQVASSLNTLHQMELTQQATVSLELLAENSPKVALFLSARYRIYRAYAGLSQAAVSGDPIGGEQHRSRLWDCEYGEGLEQSMAKSSKHRNIGSVALPRWLGAFRIVKGNAAGGVRINPPCQIAAANLLFKALLAGVRMGAIALKALSILGLPPCDQQVIFGHWFFECCSLSDLLQVFVMRIHPVFHRSCRCLTSPPPVRWKCVSSAYWLRVWSTVAKVARLLLCLSDAGDPHRQVLALRLYCYLSALSRSCIAPGEASTQCSDGIS